MTQRMKQPGTTTTGPLSAEEITTAQKLWILACQQTAYCDVYKTLNTKRSTQLPLIRQLRLFLDKEKLIRCGGRIHNAPVSRDTKFPVLLSPKHRLTELICLSVHWKMYHGGVSITTTALRQEFRIPAIRQYVRKLLNRCIVCKKISGTAYRAPLPPPLPKVHVSVDPAFTVTGVDFTGALYIQDGGIEHKVYICLFTCATTRGVHLEIVRDLTVDSFLLAFRRFSSRKSLPKKMISDNASTYLTAAEQIRQLLNSPALKEELGRRGVFWNFIPSRAPWYGGFWERLIGLTKQALKKTLGRAFVTLPVLETVIVEVESMLNSRPLTYVSSDLADPEPLTPAHLIYGRNITSLPHPFTDDDNTNCASILTAADMQTLHNRHTQTLQHFWSRWKQEYLTALREQHRAMGIKKNRICKGDVVIVHEDNKPRLRWKLAVVEELLEGNDGGAKIRTSNCKTSRPITKLYPLEVSEALDTSSSEQQAPATTVNESSTVNTDVDVPVDVDVPASVENTESDKTTETECRPRRQAAKRAQQQIAEWIRVLSGPPGECQETVD